MEKEIEKKRDRLPPKILDKIKKMHTGKGKDGNDTWTHEALKGKDYKLVVTQAYLLSHVDDDNQNVFHKVCFIGHLELLKFLYQMAGPEYLDIHEFTLYHRDCDDLPPIYYLCERGYDEEIKVKEDQNNKRIMEKINERRHEILKILCPKDKNDQGACEWHFIAKQT